LAATEGSGTGQGCLAEVREQRQTPVPARVPVKLSVA